MSGVHRQQVDDIDIQVVGQIPEVSGGRHPRRGFGHAAEHRDQAAFTRPAQQRQGRRDSSGLHRLYVDAGNASVQASRSAGDAMLSSAITGIGLRCFRIRASSPAERGNGCSIS